MTEEKSNVSKAVLQFLGQSGFYISDGNKTVVIDPYLSDSVGEDNPLFHRIYPPPILPNELKADIYIVTHDHLDHLDPLTLCEYQYKETTSFIAPHQAARKLIQLGIAKEQLYIVEPGDCAIFDDLKIEGIFALGIGPDVLDTTGYKITFGNGKSVYHTSDTAFCELLLQAAPKADVLLTCINGKFGNLTIEQAVQLAKICDPNYVIPHHFDMMELNSENPEAFRYFCQENGLGERCHILAAMDRFEW